MIEFNNLDVKECPECGCNKVVTESLVVAGIGRRYIHTHTNGERWERREFLCGHASEWVPNFRRAEQVRPCQRSEEYRKKEADRERIRKRIRALELELSKI